MSKNCHHTRVLTISGKANDLQHASVPHLELEHDGYGLHITGLGGGDYFELTVCLDCGHVVGFEPMTDEEITEIFEDN